MLTFSEQAGITVVVISVWWTYEMDIARKNWTQRDNDKRRFETAEIW